MTAKGSYWYLVLNTRLLLDQKLWLVTHDLIANWDIEILIRVSYVVYKGLDGVPWKNNIYK
jgi:hypothetical protein